MADIDSTTNTAPKPASGSELERWLAAAVEAAGTDTDLIGPQVVKVVLDLARDAAHGVTRPAAPLATFALGLSLGGGGALADLEAAAARVADVAATWLGRSEPSGPSKGPPFQG